MSRPIYIKAPARICLFGDHQDYLGLPVIACSIARFINLKACTYSTYHNIRIKFTVTFKRCCVDAWFFSCYISSRKTTKEVLID